MIINPMIPLIIFIPLTIIALIYLYKTNKKIKLEDILIILLIVLINVRPMSITENDKVLKNNLDVLFVIDNSISMVADDYGTKETRLSGVKDITENIIKELNGARFSVMSFSNNNRILIPFMSDANTAIETIQDIKPQDYLYARGTSLNTPINDIIKSLSSAIKKENRQRIIFFISDGEITNDDKLESFANIKEYITDGAVLGFGTSKGANMLITEKYTNEQRYISDYANGLEKAISKIDENNLKQIANDMDIDYIHVTNINDCDNKIKDIKSIIKSRMTDENNITYGDFYYLFAVPLFFILLYKFYRLRRTII